MANIFNNVNDVGTVLSKMAAGYLMDNLQFAKTIDKEPDESFGSVNGYKVGDTINVNIPARFIPTTSLDITSTQQDVRVRRSSPARTQVLEFTSRWRRVRRWRRYHRPPVQRRDQHCRWRLARSQLGPVVAAVATHWEDRQLPGSRRQVASAP